MITDVDVVIVMKKGVPKDRQKTESSKKDVTDLAKVDETVEETLKTVDSSLFDQSLIDPVANMFFSSNYVVPPPPTGSGLQFSSLINNLKN